MRFDRIQVFKGGATRLLVLSSDNIPAELSEFIEKLGGVLGQKDSSFVTHLTLGWTPDQCESRSIEPIKWAVNEFELIRSFQGESRYESVGRWPLVKSS